MAFKGNGRPSQYKTSDGTKVSGVTTILGNFTNPGGLVHWAFKTGKEHPDWSSPYQKSDDAKDAGTTAHAMVEAWIHGEDPNTHLQLLDNRRDVQEAAAKAFENFLEWWNGSGLRIQATEVAVVSDSGLYGGTIDAIALDQKDRVVIIDWKTSNSLYADHVTQVAAYGELWEQTHPGVQVGGYHVCLFHKEHAQFGHHWFEDLTEARQLFRLLAQAHQLKKAVEKRI